LKVTRTVFSIFVAQNSDNTSQDRNRKFISGECFLPSLPFIHPFSPSFHRLKVAPQIQLTDVEKRYIPQQRRTTSAATRYRTFSELQIYIKMRLRPGAAEAQMHTLGIFGVFTAQGMCLLLQCSPISVK